MKTKNENEVDTPLSKPSLCFLLARRSSLQLGKRKTNGPWRRGSVAEPRGRNVFAVRITSLHMKLVSYKLSEAWILSPERNCLLRPRQLQLVKRCLLSSSTCQDLLAWPPQSIQKAEAQMNHHTLRIAPKWRGTRAPQFPFLYLPSARRPPSACQQRDGMRVV